jgi:hypothetical protein
MCGESFFIPIAAGFAAFQRYVRQNHVLPMDLLQ